MIVTDLPDHTARAHFVYGLLCPDTNQIVYVGKTCNPKARAQCHLSMANGTLEEPVHRWMSALAQEGKAPGFEVLCKLTGPMAEHLALAAERRAIQSLSFNHPLLNVQHNLCRIRESQRVDRRRMLTHRGVTQSMSAWARKIGISPERLRQRLGKYSVTTALTTPKGSQPKR